MLFVLINKIISRKHVAASKHRVINNWFVIFKLACLPGSMHNSLLYGKRYRNVGKKEI